MPADTRKVDEGGRLRRFTAPHELQRLPSRLRPRGGTGRGTPEGQQQAELRQVGRDAALGRAQRGRGERRADLAEAQLEQEIEHLAQRLACAGRAAHQLAALLVTLLCAQRARLAAATTSHMPRRPCQCHTCLEKQPRLLPYPRRLRCAVRLTRDAAHTQPPPS